MSILGPLIRKEGPHPIVIEGHTDRSGPAASNEKLSEQRARAVEDWLEPRGYVNRGDTDTHGYGPSRPVAPNTKPDGSDNPEGRQRNRRIEVVIDTCKS